MNLLAGIWGYYGSCVYVGSGSFFLFSFYVGLSSVVLRTILSVVQEG